jgi:cobalt-zinc-cadmium resistance protein CzcA
MITTLAAALGLSPAATLTAIGSDSQRRFVIVIVGGLMLAMLMNICLLPTLHVWAAADHDVLPEPEADFDEGL